MKKTVLGAASTLVLITTLAACGGGSSSSGGEQKEVTALCIERTLAEASETVRLPDGSQFTTSSIYNYKNTCDFSVTLAFHLNISSSFSGVITLAPMQTHRQRSSVLAQSFFACRTPSAPMRTGQIGSFENECS